jgi:acyl-CoA thioester hydrolase
MIEHTYRHRVRYRECDPMRVVYHAHYVDYFEAARTEALREHGLPYKALEDAGIIMPVVELNVRYLRPARYDDLLEVRVQFPEAPSVRVLTEYEVRRAGEDAVLVAGRVVLCFVDAARNRPVRAPQVLLDVFPAAASTPS